LALQLFDFGIVSHCPILLSTETCIFSFQDACVAPVLHFSIILSVVLITIMF